MASDQDKAAKVLEAAAQWHAKASEEMRSAVDARRDAVKAGREAGLSLAEMAEVLEVSRARVQAILREVRD